MLKVASPAGPLDAASPPRATSVGGRAGAPRPQGTVNVSPVLGSTPHGARERGVTVGLKVPVNVVDRLRRASRRFRQSRRLPGGRHGYHESGVRASPPPLSPLPQCAHVARRQPPGAVQVFVAEHRYSLPKGCTALAAQYSRVRGRRPVPPSSAPRVGRSPSVAAITRRSHRAPDRAHQMPRDAPGMNQQRP